MQVPYDQIIELKNNRMNKNGILWLLAVVITLAAAIYQRSTGPTYPKDMTFTLEGTSYEASFPRSSSGSDSCRVAMEIPASVDARLHYKRYPTNDNWRTRPFVKKGHQQVAALPPQPPAGKLQYFIELQSNGNTTYLSRSEPIIIRYKGEVSTGVLIPHVILMFGGMLFSTAAGLFALAKKRQYRLYGWITLGLLITGGFIFGPIMQLQAFGDAWTGIPFGWDLTDNKTLVAILGWTTAVVSNRKKYRPRHYVIAAILLLVIYSIPHSVMGSEYDYSQGKVTTGLIQWIF
jgi:hypothetical protein